METAVNLLSTRLMKTKRTLKSWLKPQTTILLKGPTDIISNGNEIALNKTGSPFMTKGGTGDTLAGIAGALMARGISPFEAGQAAAYLNGLAGDLAGKKFGESLMTTDLIEEIPNVIKKY